MKSFLASLFGRLSISRNSNKRSHKNGRAGPLHSEPNMERPSEPLENRDEVHRDEDDTYTCPQVLDGTGRDGKSAYRAERTKSRLADLLNGIRELSEWQSALIGAQVDARQNMREVEYEREAVSRADVSFMEELQRLKAEGQIEPFEQLSRLADNCQSARDGFGPLEDEVFEAQRRYEEKLWGLRQAEEALLEDFESQFGEVYYEESSMVSSSSSAHNILDIPLPFNVKNPELRDRQKEEKKSRKAPVSHDLGMLKGLTRIPEECIAPLRYQHSVVSTASIILAIRDSISSDDRSKEEEKDISLLGLENREWLGHQEIHYEPTFSLEPLVFETVDDEAQESELVLSLASGVCNLDLADDDDLTALPTEFQSSIEPFPKLLTDFRTRRDRINKWLLHTTLISRSEANLIGLQLQKETDSSPSPWAN